MSRSRQKPAIGMPPPDLSGFPKWRLRPSFIFTRAHGAGKSPWWFSCDLSGRFDLAAPLGTCYLANDAKTALRERFGHDLVEQGVVTWKAAHNTQVSRLQVPAGRWLANSCHDDAAAYGATRELGTCADYDIPQSWAAALHDHRFRGLRYQTRFTTGPRPNAVALFDQAGVHDWPLDQQPTPGVAACRQAGLNVAQNPSRRHVTIVDPPR
ncbi:hypothetical protein MDOR_35000 [Mycolicibacterium doricum]|uniref:RES domain-containing protein n=2 Tax=Mycolicibacterium doricum TaxID=126673 RepID=A0A7I7VY82_9MYCO|nr:RES family NAD+ phosphorylase [Mycolicibacterium doricum]BBZ09331.1 hypothetical protein MDOR_35000 [Mycolicibacterium doricum]